VLGGESQMRMRLIDLVLDHVWPPESSPATQVDT
jgi:hypothetical protein